MESEHQRAKQLARHMATCVVDPNKIYNLQSGVIYDILFRVSPKDVVLRDISVLEVPKHMVTISNSGYYLLRKKFMTEFASEFSSPCAKTVWSIWPPAAWGVNRLSQLRHSCGLWSQLSEGSTGTLFVQPQENCILGWTRWPNKRVPKTKVASTDPETGPGNSPPQKKKARKGGSRNSFLPWG